VELGRLELGLLGGAFDPPHVGHVALGRAAIEHFGLPRLLVLVVADPGHKNATTSSDVRLELTRLAFEDVPQAEVTSDRHGRTVDSLEEMRPKDAIFILGGDEFADFPDWKEPARILELVQLGVALRPGVPDARVQAALARSPAPRRVSFFEMTPVPVSSSDVRERVARGESIGELLPLRVADAIDRLGLYSGDSGYTRTNPSQGQSSH
jgi:nicotinate-nucleotide adenylyltransferase